MGLSKPPLARVVEVMINEIPRDEEKPGWKPISGHSSAFMRRAWSAKTSISGNARNRWKRS